MDIKSGVVVFSYVLAVGFLAVFAVIVLKMLTNTIDLRHLIEEPTGKASLSRFQMLVFTMVIAGLYVILSIENGQLIEVPNGVLGLLGISGGSYVIAKGIASSSAKDPAGSEKKDQNSGSV